MAHPRGARRQEDQAPKAAARATARNAANNAPNGNHFQLGTANVTAETMHRFDPPPVFNGQRVFFTRDSTTREALLQQLFWLLGKYEDLRKTNFTLEQDYKSLETMVKELQAVSGKKGKNGKKMKHATSTVETIAAIVKHHVFPELKW